jgi:hypothetical protein
LDERKSIYLFAKNKPKHHSNSYTTATEILIHFRRACRCRVTDLGDSQGEGGRAPVVISGCVRDSFYDLVATHQNSS